jgi:hypothetical protein
VGLRNQYRGTWGWPDPAVQNAFLLFNLTIDQIRTKVLLWGAQPSFHGTKGSIYQRIGLMPQPVVATSQPSQHMSCDPSRVGLCAPTDVPPASLPKAGARPRLPFAFTLAPHKRRPVKKNLASDMPHLVTHSGCINGCSALWRSVPLGRSNEPGSGPSARRH